MLEDFIKAVGSATTAAGILNVSGTVIHKWKRQGASKKADRRMALWLAYNVERERFILRNVWAKEDGLWHPGPEEYQLWLVTEFNFLRAVVGIERSSALWNELQQ